MGNEEWEKNLEREIAQELKKEREQELENSLDKILEYAEWEEEEKKEFAAHLAAYGKLTDKNASGGEAAALRAKLTALFYNAYKSVVSRAVEDKDLPVVIRMFLDFGYVDKNLAGEANTEYLYELAQNLPTDPERGVYSFYEWLLAIYNGKKEPSRNELDMDFREYLHEQKRQNKITARQEEDLLLSNISKVMFEVENVFPVINKLTFGQLSIFCPVFSSHNIYRPLDTSLVTADKVGEVIEDIRSKDFKAFYRETLYSLPERKINERIEVEVLPDVILFPNVGERSIMWQEIEGKKRTTPARMMCSVFHSMDLSQSLVHLVGEFRWEMCKRAQGARWNDVSDPSLTSEYFDYIQFYRKNRDLSAEVKDKIKTQLVKARNSYKEMFVLDYILWIKFESGGLPRLNKVVRNILFSYCPFSKEIRGKIGGNPLYKQASDRYEVRNAKTLHRITLLCRKLENQAEGVPEELAAYKQYLES